MVRNNVLFIGATHGDEVESIKVLKELDRLIKKNKSDWIIGNEVAFPKGKRYIDVDLNRASPGDSSSNTYEEKRAAEIINISQRFNYTIDLHTTKSDTGVFVIITKPTIENIFLACSLEVDNIVIWSSKRSSIKGPLTKDVGCGVEVEFGPRGKLHDKLNDFILETINKDIKVQLDNIKKKDIFYVYGKLLKPTRGLENFKEINIKNEIFYPILVDEYSDIACYKTKKLNLIDLLSY